MTKKVYLHVGTPKTGTSYLQHVLYHNRRTLHRHGINYPARRFDAHFLAALDLMRMPWGGLEAQAIGSWDKLATSVRRASGDSIISHEILATASRVQIGRALDSLGHGRDAEVHLVLSVRDLVRQVPAEWQENVKHRAALSYGAFLDQIRDPRREGRIPTWFWGVQEIPDILDRWGHDLPPEHVHVVTVPPAGGSPELLWKRFVEAFGLDGIDLQLDGERANPSLGSAETTLIRRINRAANEELEPAFYRPLVRELLAHQTLSRRTRTPRLALPPDVYPWARELEESWIAEIRAREYDVIGDLDDLRGAPPADDYADPDHPDEALVSRAAVDALKAVLLDHARLQRVLGQREGELYETQRLLEKAHLRPTYRWREKLVRRLETGHTGQLAMKAYRRARGRSSRSA
ncbi:MAG TPA: hypothetical protein VH085_14385 [Nocardioides sp.]|nr:hypothetical protein [Nocardioides sp.]